jgi:arabinofuranosyltransferase
MAELTPLADGPLASDVAFAQWVVSKKKLIFALAILASIFWTVLYLDFTVDDAYISFRYGKNLVAHHLWNWNSSGSREEAYTSAVYTALSILPALLHMSPALFFKFIGLGSIAVIIYRLHTVASSSFAFLLALLLVALNPWVWTHAFAGLETPLYILLILEMAIAVHRAPTTSPIWVYTLFLLLPLTRPEGIVFACAGVVLFWKLRGKAPRQLPYFGLALCLAIFYFFTRMHYFHNLLPNPFYVKLGPNSWRSVLSHLALNLTQSKAYFLTLILVLLLARKLTTRVFALCALLLLLLLFAPFRVAMNYSDRFYFQLTFPILLFFFITEDVAPISRLATLIAVFSLVGISDTYLTSNLTYFADFKHANIDLGRRLAPFAPGHSLVTGEAGGIPYFSNWVVYDPVGIGTGNIARHGVTLPLLQQLHPDLIFVYSTRPGPGVLDSPLGDPAATPGPPDSVLLDYIRQSGNYHYAGTCRWPIGYYLISFLRDDTPQHDQILTALQQNTSASAVPHHSIRDLLLQRYVPWTDQ